MRVEVRYFMDDKPCIGTISSDFKYIVLPEGYLSPYISGHGKIPVKTLKIPKNISYDAKELNQNI